MALAPAPYPINIRCWGRSLPRICSKCPGYSGLNASNGTSVAACGQICLLASKSAVFVIKIPSFLLSTKTMHCLIESDDIRVFTLVWGENESSVTSRANQHALLREQDAFMTLIYSKAYALFNSSKELKFSSWLDTQATSNPLSEKPNTS